MNHGLSRKKILNFVVRAGIQAARRIARSGIARIRVSALGVSRTRARACLGLVEESEAFQFLKVTYL